MDTSKRGRGWKKAYEGPRSKAKRKLNKDRRSRKNDTSGETRTTTWTEHQTLWMKPNHEIVPETFGCGVRRKVQRRPTGVENRETSRGAIDQSVTVN